MAGNLHLIAATGTDNLAQTIQTNDESLDFVLNKMETDNVAARLLRGAGLLNLREQAGYVPSQDPRPLKKAIKADVSHEANSYSYNNTIANYAAKS